MPGLKMLKDSLTGKDGESFDVGRILAGLSGTACVFFQGWDVIANHVAFNPMNFGAGIGALAAGIGALLKLKEGSEP